MQLKRLLLYVILLTLLLMLQACHSSKTSVLTKKYSPSQLQQDAAVLRNVVLTMHPAVGIYKNKSYYENMFNQFISSLKDSLTERDFRLKLKLIMDELHCGHTEVLASKTFYKESSKTKQNYSPYLFLPLNDQLFMISNVHKKPDTLLKKGSEILKINGISADSMLRYSKRFISTDGFNITGRNHYLQIGFNSIYPVLFGRPDTFMVEFRDSKQMKKIKYPATQLKSLPPLPIGRKDDSLNTVYRKARMRYRFMDKDKKTMLLRIDRFSHRKSGKAYRHIFRSLHRYESKNLVIDLRNNGGGSLANTYHLLSYLIDQPQTQTLRTSIKSYPYRKYTHGNIWFKFTRAIYRLIGTKKSVNDTDYFMYTIQPKKKNAFKGKVFVLINGGSFSASCLVAAYLKQTGRTVFIGEETGGAQEGCNAGITPYYNLPNTHIRARIPAFRIVHDVSPGITGRGILPDYKTEYMLKDITTRQDLDIQKVKELLKIE